jgi:hypothetical protein
MTNDHTIELIHRELDGLNSREESADLVAFLSTDPEARKLHDDLVRLKSLLKTVEPAEPPRYLKNAIIGAIQRSWAQSTRDFFASLRLTPAHAFTFAGGLAVGILAFSLVAGNAFTDHSVDLTNLYGTVMSADLVGKLPISDQKSFDRPGVHASVTLRASEALVVAELHFQSEGEVKIGLQYAADAISFKSFGQLRNAPNNVSIEQNSIRINNAGENHYALVFERKSLNGFPLRYSVYRSGSIVHSEDLSVYPLQQKNR